MLRDFSTELHYSTTARQNQQQHHPAQREAGVWGGLCATLCPPWQADPLPGDWGLLPNFCPLGTQPEKAKYAPLTRHIGRPLLVGCLELPQDHSPSQGKAGSFSFPTGKLSRSCLTCSLHRSLNDGGCPACSSKLRMHGLRFLLSLVLVPPGVRMQRWCSGSGQDICFADEFVGAHSSSPPCAPQAGRAPPGGVTAT